MIRYAAMRFIVTAGPTREHVDPVRFLSNPSTGRMGFAVARAARAAGHDVTLVAGPVSLRTPPGVRRVDVVSARDMLVAVLAELGGPRSRAAARLIRIGFAAETGVPDAEAARKCREKGLDLVVGNDVTRPDSGFGTTTNRVTFVTPDGRAHRLPLMSKLAVARRIVAFAERIASNG